MEPIFFTISLFLSLVVANSGDLEALLALKSSNDLSHSLQWQGRNFCTWPGVKECKNGRLSKLVLEHLNLNGTLDPTVVNQLDQLRVLSLKGNSITGLVPDLSGLTNLKLLYLNYNDFYGEFPVSLARLPRLKVIVLSGNRISGRIPVEFVGLQRLYRLYLEDNRLTGEIPALNQSSLRFFNVSNNLLSGQIPVTGALARFNASSFSGNIALCGEQIGNPCKGTIGSNPSPSPANLSVPHHHHRHLKRWKLAAIIAGSTLAGILLLILLLCFILNRKKRSRNGDPRASKSVSAQGGAVEADDVDRGGGFGPGPSSGGGADSGRGGVGSLVFCGPGDQLMSYSLEDLLRASAETLGRGTMGSTYKAVMESGFIVTVKRLKDTRVPARAEDFRRHVDLLGSLRHPNLVPLRAYFQAKEERLLVYDYFPNGSLFSLIHGSRASGGGKPLHWTSCLKIAEDLATGLLYIHQNPGLTHGNLKSSNVLLGPDFESCLTDYGLNPFQNPDSHEESSATSLFYRAPECRDIRKAPTQQADTYSFGVLLLELLTGKTPFQDLVQEHGSNIPSWVKSVREEETEAGDEPASSNEASEEKLATLLNIAMSCISLAPENRPVIRDVLRMIRESRAEAQVSSNSSDHSPGRWSDTVQSLPREEQLNI